MSTCCQCCKTPQTDYIFSQTTCGICTSLGKPKCNYSTAYHSPAHKPNLKILESTNHNHPYHRSSPINQQESPQFSETIFDHPLTTPQGISHHSLQSIYVTPFSTSPYRVIIPIFYDPDMLTNPRNSFPLENEDEMTTFRPRKFKSRPNKKEPLSPSELLDYLFSPND